ncbi:uncharacterized protein LOC123704092 [Colias croceus]|uniref:uncharacterized protein LOC123704092 n=1 Tax=Colias crocea TaxID=72248 RepID=UPI001E27F77C|nr:uncharacterized protein LOC123704092 [Colias croceus]
MFICLCVLYVKADEIELEATSGVVLKMLREMVNETKADSLNLPANATSIRENITDTFSCENRVYGYYADVDNDCQIFHVCLPSQTPTGRNVTYRWSFICPSETVFNQEVLVCTRSRDSIPCEDSPSYYDLNMEIGKISEDKKEQPETDNKIENEQTDKPKQPEAQKETETVTVKNQKRFPSRKQNMVEKLVQAAVEEMNLMEEGVEVIEPEEKTEEKTEEKAEEKEELQKAETESDKFEDSRLGAERSIRTGRKWRGSYRYNRQ